MALAGLTALAMAMAAAQPRPARAQDATATPAPASSPPTPAPTSTASPYPTTATVPAASSPPAAAARRVTGHVSTELSTYADTDHVGVLTPAVAGELKDATAGWSARGSYLLDAVSAASVDIVSTASPRWSEIRQAGALEGTFKPRDLGVTAAASFSSEPDYLAYAAGGSATLDLDQKNFTLLVGYGYGHDTIGRAGTPFSVFSRTLQRNALNAGLTVAATPATLLVFGGDLVIERGDQSKPYRYIPLFAPDVAPGIARGASGADVNDLRLPERPLEQLPLARDRYAAWGRFLHRFRRATLRLDERLYADSWGLHASTGDARLLVDHGERWMVTFHGRFHAQSAVSFWQRAYTLTTDPGGGFPARRTGDRELGPLWGATGGGGLRWNGGPAARPTAWTLGGQLDVMWTSFLDDLYITSRLGAIVTFVWEVEL